MRGSALACLWLPAALVCGLPDRATATTSLAVTNVADVLSNVAGGARAGTAVLDKFDLTLNHDNDAGTLIFVDLQVTDGTDFIGRTGSSQGVSSIDAPAGVRLLDAWVQTRLASGLVLKAGITNFNDDFDTQPTAALFLNPSHGIGPDISQSGLNGPSIFPATGLGVITTWQPDEGWTAKAGLFEGVPGDPRHPGQTVIALSPTEGVLLAVEMRKVLGSDLIVGAGAWGYSAAFETLEFHHRAHGNGGVYGIVDAVLLQDDVEALHGWFRCGWANPAFNPIAVYLGGGLVYYGPFGLAGDFIGLAFASAFFGTAERHIAARSPAETILELTYSMAVSAKLRVQPDLQYIISPGGDRTLGNAVIVGARLTASYDL